MSEFSDQKLLEILREHIPGIDISGEIARLSGGNINFVWRARGAVKNVIIKHAPPHIATNREVPLSDSRIHFEARALKLLDMESKTEQKVRPPKLYAYDEEHSLIIMEDVGDFQELTTATLASGSPQKTGDRLGEFIGNLHRRTFQDERLSGDFHNLEIQKVRNQLQYQPAWEYAGLKDTEQGKEIKAKSQDLGNRLLEKGQCLVMGDLWPPSIFVGDRNEIRLIDWEFVHFGRPLQDVGHLAAHCWMQSYIEESTQKTAHWKTFWEAFITSYQKEMEPIFEQVFDDQQKDDLATHIGTEILMRISGPFKEGYIFESYDKDDPLFENAVNQAVDFIIRGKTSLQKIGMKESF